MRRTRQILDSIDRHIAHGNVLVERNSDVIELNSKVFERESELNRNVMSEMVERNERTHHRMMGVLNDLRDDVQAQTKATLAMLDRLPPPPPRDDDL